MRPINESEESFESNLVPMIDVIFSILAFFIISSLPTESSAAIECIYLVD